MTDSGELAGSTAAKTGARPPRLSALLVPLVLLAASALLLATAPMGGDFWWSDAPRHALNGAFVKDLVAAFPIHDPRGWAVDYYLQYPSLSILFYPPLFYAVEAVMFAVLASRISRRRRRSRSSSYCLRSALTGSLASFCRNGRRSASRSLLSARRRPPSGRAR